MTASCPIFTELILAWQLFTNSCNTKCHDNTIDSLVADTKSQKDRQRDIYGLHISRWLFRKYR